MARGLGLHKPRLLLIGSVFALVSAESILLIGATTGTVRLFLLSTLFLFYLFSVFLTTTDTVSNSEGLGVLKFLGANRAKIAEAVAAGVFEAGLVGAVGGVALALLVSRSVFNLPSPPALTDLVFVFASCAAGIAAGVALGVRLSWKSSI